MNQIEESTVSQRLRAFLKEKNLNASSLSKKLGGNSQKYYKLLDGASNPQYETIMSILHAFPELSSEWLLRGEGDMFMKVSLDEVVKMKGELLEKDKIIAGLEYLNAKHYGKKAKAATPMPMYKSIKCGVAGLRLAIRPIAYAGLQSKKFACDFSA